MPGFWGTLGGNIAGMARGGLGLAREAGPGYMAGMAARGTQALLGSPTGLGALAGGTLGGMYGAFSSGTSVLGGAMAGAAMGAGAGRYGRPGYLGVAGSLRAGMGLRRSARMGANFAYAGMKADALSLYGRGTTLASNLGNGFRARFGR